MEEQTKFDFIIQRINNSSTLVAFKGTPDNTKTIEWYGEEVDEFLELANKLGTRLIYFEEAQVENDDGSASDVLELGFFYNGVYHKFVQD